MTIKINGTNTTAQPSITGTDTDTGLVYGTDEVSIVTGGTDRVTVTNTGMGIGTSSPGTLLDIYGTGAAERIVNSTSGLTSSLIFGNDLGTPCQIFLNGSTRSTFGGAGAFNIYQGSANPILFSTNNTERLRIQSGGGISFNGDTAAANALDDYEEGTFSPNLSTTGTGSFSNYNLFYIKVGRIVSINGRVQTTRTGSATGVLQFQLPFVADNSITNAGNSWMSHGNCFTHAVSYPGDANGSPFFWEINTTTTAGWFYTRNGSSWASANPNLISTGSQSYLTFSMVYRAAA